MLVGVICDTPAGLDVGEGTEGGTENKGEFEGVGEDVWSGAEDEGEPKGGAKTDQENSSADKLQHLHFLNCKLTKCDANSRHVTC